MNSIRCPICGFVTDESELASFGECRGCGWDGSEGEEQEYY